MRKLREQTLEVHRGWLRDLRVKKGWTMQELAEEVGVRADYIGYLERGHRNPSFSLAMKLSEVLEFPMQDLYVNALPRQDRSKKAQ